MTHQVLLISLGPVQDFIASARKCRDLWFGSWVLSELAKAAAAGIFDALGGEGAALEALVFPAVENRRALDAGSALSVANKLVVRVPGDGARVREVAERGRAEMARRRSELRDEAFDRVGKNDPQRQRHFLDRIESARQQVDELFEYLWVAVAEAESDGEAGYAVARAEADRLLAARKNGRSWQQPTWALEGVPKSSLDGVRESVLHEDIYDHPVTGRWRDASLKGEQRRHWYGVHGAERLCGVGLLKRWGVQRTLDLEAGQRENERFFSTPHLAAFPLLRGIAADAERHAEIAEAWRALCAAAGPAKEDFDIVPRRGTGLFGKTDGAILFPQRLAETLVECDRARGSDFTRAALAAQERFFKVAGRSKPLPYYAILVADGDSMGARINEQQTPGEHRAFSKQLDSFAQSARRIVEDQHDGCLIYSGGDDVLAFLPLHQAIECAFALAQRFKGLTGATLSAGLAIVHYTEPLGVALEVAREAEKRAKEVPGKNALAVALDKRSGETTVVCDHWDPLVPRLLELCTLHAADAIPDKAGYELLELSRLGGDLLVIQKSEARRILRRKRARHGQEKIAATTLEQIEAHLGEDPAELGREIVIAAQIAKAKKQAEPSAKEGA